MVMRKELPFQPRTSRYRTLIEWSLEAIAVHRDGVLIYVNPAAVKLMGAGSAKDLLGQPMIERVHPDYREIVRARLLGMTAHSHTTPMIEEQLLRLDGTAVDVEVQSTTIELDGKPAIQVAIRDITARKLAEQKLTLAASVFTHAREGIMITAVDGTILDVNEAFSRITLYSRDEVLGRNPRLLNSGRHDADFYAAMWAALAEPGHWYGEVWNRRRDGQLYAAMQTISAVRDAAGRTLQYVGLFSDITPLKEQQRQLEHVAHFDALTNLPNRVLLADRLHQAMVQAQRREQPLAVVFLDLDGFKSVNDRHGHGAGDQLLIAVGARMKQALREGDTLARLGGDEFVAVLLDLADVAAGLPLLTRLLAAAAQPVEFGGVMLKVSASLGVTFFPQAEEIDADQLLRQADQAMYQAKLAGKNRYHLFDSELDRSMRGHYQSVERIRRALEQREFVLHYQPKVNMRTGMVMGAETLIRWQHPQRGLLAPAVFLPVIENHPLAIAIGEWVLDSALRQMALWQAQGLDITLSVNVGARQLQQPDFAQRLQQILAAHPQVRPGCLELEVLQSSVPQEMAAVSQVMRVCREIGVSFALTDFGAGNASLTYLQRLPVSLLKVDQCFVRDMLDSADDMAILEGVIGLASAFRRQIVAQGVESPEHGAMLLQLGCELAQGYGIAHPMPADEFPRWAAAWRTHPSWCSPQPVPGDELALLHAGVEYRAWMTALGGHLAGGHEAAPALDHQQCHFGQWLQREGLARHGVTPPFSALHRLHRQSYELAARLCELKAGGRAQEALAGLDQLHELRDALFAQLKTLTQAGAALADLRTGPAE